MSILPDHANSATQGQPVRTTCAPIDNENQAGDVPAEIITGPAVDGQLRQR